MSFNKAGSVAKWPSAFDLIKLCTGVAKDLGLHSDTVSAVCRQFAVSRDAKKGHLRFRASSGPKRALGWVPFIPRAVQLSGNAVTYLKRRFLFWKFRDLGGALKAGLSAGITLMRYARNYTVPLTLAFAGFVIGIFWSDFSSVVRPVFSNISGSLLRLETLSQTHPFESGVAFAVIGALITPVTIWLKKIIRSLIDQPAIVDILFKNEEHVYGIIAHMKQDSFKRIGGNEEVILPDNALFLPSAVAMSIMLLSRYCQKRYGDHKSAIFHYDHDHWEAQDHNFICVGGPFVNQTVKYILDRKLVPDFSIDNIPTAFDQADRYQAKRENGSMAPKAPLTDDYGFVIYIDNPWNSNKKICVLFGLWPHGTQASVEIILSQRSRFTYLKELLHAFAVDNFGGIQSESYNFTKLYNSIKNNRNTIGIVHVTVAGLLAGKAEVIKVRNL